MLAGGGVYSSEHEGVMDPDIDWGRDPVHPSTWRWGKGARA